MTPADPFAERGLHVRDAGLTLRYFDAFAERVFVKDVRSDALHPTIRGRDGMFSLELPGRSDVFPYRLIVERGGRYELEDPYRFGPILGELDSHLIAQGTHQRLWEKLGANRLTVDGVDGVAFAVWAPNAGRVSVVGDFNDWDGRRHPMRFRLECGVWEIFIPGVEDGAHYKYEVEDAQGRLLPLKADPFARAAELRPQTASIVFTRSAHEWRDAGWLRERASRTSHALPMSIYEVHLGSWKRGDANQYLTYDEIADALVPYAVEMGFTHLEFMPVTEHPFDTSWGYQATGLFAPTSRFGPPDGFKRLVDRAHQAGIAVILDWVPGHFPSDAHSLARFDGTALYEYADPRKGFQPDWKTFVYNFGRREVANFLIASALFWLAEFHIDGLRVDAVASMIHLDYSRKPGEWEPNRFGGAENLEAVDFVRRCNELVHAAHPGAVMIAEESTSWPMVSGPIESGGLGFDYKWNMGWMHDMLDYFSYDPIFRKYNHEHLTFGIMYAWNERFVLPFSHDEVVYGKGSILRKMPGDRWQQFANVRALYALMYAYPGKKLLFMGDEFAQWNEWTYFRSLDWNVLAEPDHAGVKRLVRDLNLVYRDTPALHEADHTPEGFRWIAHDDRAQSVVSFLRYDAHGAPGTVCVLNATPVIRRGYRIGVPAPRWREVINTDLDVYGGSGICNAGTLEAARIPMHAYADSLALDLPPLGVVWLVPTA